MIVKYIFFFFYKRMAWKPTECKKQLTDNDFSIKSAVKLFNLI